MNDDRTRSLDAAPLPPQPAGPALEVSYTAPDGGQRKVSFEHAFIIGRAPGCAMRIDDPNVSRRHSECFLHQGQWWLRDLDSRNGTYLNGKRIRQTPLGRTATLVLGEKGPQLRLDNPSVATENLDTPDAIAQRYFSAHYDGPIGEHTAMVRQAFKTSARRRSRPYWIAIALALVVVLAISGIAVQQYHKAQIANQKVRQLNALAVDIFYAMKTLELQVINLRAGLYQDTSEQFQGEIDSKQQQLEELRGQYASFIEQINRLQRKLNDKDQLIQLMARNFGECEANMPDDFVAEVKRYIARWKATDRYQSALQRLQQNGYTETIVKAMQAQGLAPQFLYLAMQESNFRTQAVGPVTRYGHAKGMWQFIGPTATRYGLQLGPQARQGVYDPLDERHDFAKSTRAAAAYLSDIYRTDAQASGLLVMASYNWGEGNIIKRIRQLPENPRERNFWTLLQHHKIPSETYDYVFYIFSAAVIGENPRVFGFDFDSPLDGYD